jgi:predicted peptidase
MIRLVVFVFIFAATLSCAKRTEMAIRIPAAAVDTVTKPEPEYEIRPATLIPVTKNINDAIGGYYVGLPAKYNATIKSYPLLVFIHGGGQFGNGQLDLPVLLNEGIPQLYDEKIFPPDFEVGGEHFSFVMVAPQLRRNPTNEELHSFIKYAQENYRIDSSRIYLVGMSNGGRITCNVAAAYPWFFAAIVPMAGVPDSLGLEVKTSRIAESNLPVWIFHNDSDEVIDIRLPIRFVESIENYRPVIKPRLTRFERPMGLLGHDAWTRATNPQFRENNTNIYEWMLSYHR